MRRKILSLLFFAMAFVICLPVLMTVLGAFMSDYELNRNLSPVLAGGNHMAHWQLLPLYPILSHYLDMLLCSPEYLMVFWNSAKIVCCILAGQLLVGVPAAWAFAGYRSNGSRRLFRLYVVLMLMPFQVTMLSSYLVLDGLQVLNTHASVILPAVFSTFPVFLIYRSFCTIPQGMLEAARIDGAGELRIFLHIGLPLGSTGVLSAMVLGFLEYWSMIEQPMAFLKDPALMPLSLYLPEVRPGQIGNAFAAAVIALVPAALVFMIGQDYLEQGIIAAAMKE